MFVFIRMGRKGGRGVPYVADSGSNSRVQGSGFRVQGSGFRVQGSGFRVQGSEIRDQRSEIRDQRSEIGDPSSGRAIFGCSDSIVRQEEEIMCKLSAEWWRAPGSTAKAKMGRRA
jgi:hypothetical protein